MERHVAIGRYPFAEATRMHTALRLETCWADAVRRRPAGRIQCGGDLLGGFSAEETDAALMLYVQSQYRFLAAAWWQYVVALGGVHLCRC
jgi:hypothetical protein